ncbi:MAG: efflux RND transporter periplasmic adaptor subunit [Pseudomonadota bacterium]
MKTMIRSLALGAPASAPRSDLLPIHDLRAIGALGAILLGALATSAAADGPEPMAVYSFEGVVEASQSATVAPRVDGIVAEILIGGGERVSAGDVMFRLDPETYRIEADLARAAVAQAEAAAQLADEAAARQQQLLERGPGSPVAAREAKLRADIADAELAAARADLAAAQLALDRTDVRAPFDGIASRPAVRLGDFLEAEAGAILGTIVALDPVIVAYAVPHETRLAALARSGEGAAQTLFERLSLTLTLPGGKAYPHPGRPLFESVTLDAASGALTTWGRFPNPDGVLVPGLAVTVTSTLMPEVTQ